MRFGPKGGEEPVFKQDGSGFLKSFTDRFKNSLGPITEELIAKNNQERREAEKQLKEHESLDSQIQKENDELQYIRNRREQNDEKIRVMVEEGGSVMDKQNELERLKQLKQNLGIEEKNKTKELATLQKRKKEQSKEEAKLKKDVDKLKASISAKTKETIDMETRLNRTKPFDELEETYETLKCENEEDQRIIDDENAHSDDKQAAEDRIANREERMERLAPQIQEREEALPLRERVKNIFKKYGWTLQAVVLATGLVLGAVALAALNGLKAGTKAVGKGLKTIGQKLGFLLPGLIGWIVSFIFKSARQVLSFLGEHAWLLILAVVAFFMERLLKKRCR